jgi:site-specific recombinase XerD
MNTLGTLVMKFFHKYLADERGVSSNTINSYSDCVRLLLDYSSQQLGVTADKMRFDAISDQIILDFLDHIETERKNMASTRNQRLAAIKTFFRFLARHEPTMLATCERVCAIRAKNVPHKVMETLDNHEVKAIFDGLEADTVHDARDLALLSLMYNTGARVQELVDLDVDDVRMDAPHHAKLTGKGRKERIIPLHKETVESLHKYLDMRKETGVSGKALFLNDRGERISRFGISHIVKERTREAVGLAPSLQGRKISPHTFRHTVALHLIQSGVDIMVVKEWLGHADVKTTCLYVEINIEMKRKALEALPVPAQPPGTGNETQNWRKPGVMKFLNGLSRGTALC